MNSVFAAGIAVDPASLGEHLGAIRGPRRRPIDGMEIDATLDHLRERFTEFGWRVRDQPCHDPYLGDGVNVIATLAGADHAARVVVGAHHDTVPGSPGADDNGSGLAALVELARSLGGHRWEADIELVAFDFEESNDPSAGTATFAGSRAYVAELPSGVALRGAFVYDLIGYADHAPGSQRLPPGIERLFPEAAAALEQRGSRGDFLTALGRADGTGGPLLRSFVEAAAGAVPGLPVVPIPVPPGAAAGDLYRSDHVSFWEAGLPALMLSDTGDLRNPHYHRPTDTIETLDPQFWSACVRASAAAVARLARLVQIGARRS